MGKTAVITRIEPWEGVILGQPYSKANSRMIVQIRGKTRLIKSIPALNYLQAFRVQCPTLRPMFEEDVHAELIIYYANRRPDVDESLVLDAMQGRIYRNDRQVRKKTVEGRIDASEPRVIIRVSPLA